jgi:hypothetical protein
MPKKILDPNVMTRAQLSDALLRSAHSMPTGEMATKRTARVLRALSTTDTDRMPLCLGDDRCGLLSCFGCRTQQQLVLTYKLSEEIKRRGDRENWWALTIVPQNGKVEPGNLPKGGLRGFANTFSAVIRKCDPSAEAAMCVDISWDRMAGDTESWRCHFHGVIRPSHDQFFDRLRERFPGDEGCMRPVHVKQLTDVVGWGAYMYKPQFWMREQRPDATGDLEFVKKSLTIDQEVMFVRAFAKLKAKHRFFCIGMKL